MGLRERRYHFYTGQRTSALARTLVIPRYALADAFRSRWLTVLFSLSFFLPVLGAILIYLRHNLNALEALRLQASILLPIDEEAFLGLLSAQAFGFGFVLTATLAPSLVAADLRNNALALYLGRPLSRSQYVLGKLAVLAALLSAITWVPGLLLFALQAYLEDGWLAAHARIAPAVFFGSWLWILALSLLALALSAWLRLRFLASGALVGMIFVGQGFAVLVEQILGSRWGHLLSFLNIVFQAWSDLMGRPGGPLPAWSAYLALFALIGLSLLLLSRKIQPQEVVRS